MHGSIFRDACRHHIPKCTRIIVAVLSAFIATTGALASEDLPTGNTSKAWIPLAF